MMPLTTFLANSWFNWPLRCPSSESAPHLMNEVDAVRPSLDVIVKLHGQNSCLPCIWGIETSLLLAPIWHLVSNREMLVVTEIGHRSSHHFEISLKRCRSRSVHQAICSLKRREDLCRMTKLQAVISCPIVLKLSGFGPVTLPSGRGEALKSEHRYCFVCTQPMHTRYKTWAKTWILIRSLRDHPWLMWR